MNGWIRREVLKPVGVVHTKASESQIEEEHRDVEAVVEIFSEFEDTLEGLDGYSRLLLLSYFRALGIQLL